MKTLIVICFTVFCSLPCFSQKDKVDSYIKEINNNQIHFIVQYATRIEMKSPAGDSLIKVGKSATKRLVSLLDNSKKGIISHYILLRIWGSPKGDCDWPHNNEIEAIDCPQPYWLCGLWYCEGEKGNYARNVDLQQNKEKWGEFLKLKSSR